MKKTKNKKNKPKGKKQVNYLNEIQGILILALGILMMLSFYVKDSIGSFGMFLREVSLGLLGVPAFLVPPVIIIYAALLIFAHEKIELKNKPLYILFLFLLVSAMIQTGHYRPEKYSGLSPIKALGLFYADGNALAGGGVLGGIISLPFLVTFKVLGTIIVITALSLIDVILLTNSSISDFVKRIRSIIINRSKDKQNKGFDGEDDDIRPDIEEDGDEISLRFDKKPKIIDFRIEKSARELRDKKKSQASDKETGVEVIVPGPDSEEEPFELVMADLKKQGKTKRGRERDEAAPDGPGLKEIVIKQPGSKKASPARYAYPPFDLLVDDTESGNSSKNYRSQVLEGAKKLEETLGSFGVSAKVVNVTRGPTVTRYELQPSAGVKVSRIVSLSDDIALNLAAPAIRLEAPIPGKAAIGIEVPNKEINIVRARDVIESSEFMNHPSKLAFAVGKDVSGEIIIVDIARMPHLLIAGATGSGKSVCINNLIVSLLYKASPDEVKLLMIDTKVVELGVYNGIPHLLIPVVTDPKKSAGALNWAVQEMVNRYRMFADKSVRDIKGYNELMAKLTSSRFTANRHYNR